MQSQKMFCTGHVLMTAAHHERYITHHFTPHVCFVGPAPRVTQLQSRHEQDISCHKVALRELRDSNAQEGISSSTVRDADVCCTKYVLVVKHRPREEVMCMLGMTALEGYISCISVLFPFSHLCSLSINGKRLQLPKVIINIKVPKTQTTVGTDGEIYCKEKCNISWEMWPEIIFMRDLPVFLSVCSQFLRTVCYMVR